ncbi:MAG: hypothetical protein WC635_10330 [Bacteriovorax sp.]|jgi:outer membrane biosynthesis protein TonB
MTQVILVDNDKQLVTILRANLFKKYGWEVIAKETSSEAISMLQILSDVELIITRDSMGKDSAANKLCEYLTVNKADFAKEIPVLILGKKNHAYPKATEIDPTSSSEKIVIHAGVLLGVAEFPKEPEVPKVVVAPPTPAPPIPVPASKPQVQPQAHQPIKPQPQAPPVAVQKTMTNPLPVEDYIGLDTRYYLNLDGINIPFDSFTRAKQKDNSYEYTVKIASGSPIESTGIERMITRGVGELFIHKSQHEQALKFVKSNLLDKVKNPDIAGLDRVKLASDVFEITLELVKDLSIDDFSVELINENIKAMGPIIKSPNVFALFNNGVRIKKISYGFAHCFLTSILLHKILPKFDWATDEIKNNVYYLAYLHDMTLQNDKLIKLHHHYFQESKTLSPEESVIVLQHAMAAANIVEKIKVLPAGIAPMIKEHHGIKSGKGFSDSLSIIISPLAMSFLTIEEFVTRYLDITEEVTSEHLKNIFLELEKKFNKLTYDQTLKSIGEIYK